MIGGRKVGRRPKARCEELGFAAFIQRYGVGDRKIGLSAARERLDVVKRFLREPAEHVVDVLMQQRHADLRVVNQIVGILLPHAKPELALPDGMWPPELELCVALGLEVELRRRRLERKVEQLAPRPAETFSNENGSKKRPMYAYTFARLPKDLVSLTLGLNAPKPCANCVDRIVKKSYRSP